MPTLKSMPATRELALIALHEIWQRGKKPKKVIEELSGSIDERERSFLMELVYGVLRYRDTIDWSLKCFLKKPSGLGNNTLNNLRLAAYQILFMRVPEWAAVNEAVEMEKEDGRPELVNAVLRNLLRKPEAERLDLEAIKKKNAISYIAVSTSHPAWLIRRWAKRFGESEAMKIAEANNRIPTLTLRVNTLKSKREQIIKELSAMGIKGEPTPYSPDGIKLKEFHTFKELTRMKESLIVQDEASQLITCLLDPQPGEKVLDACSAPGGKTTHIAQLMKDRGEITAIEIEEERLGQLRENISNLGMKSVKIIQCDLRSLDRSEIGFFDKILLDAPCSSLGVIRKNPDIKYRHRPDDLKEFKMKQREMLNSISKLVRAGGIIVYSVCSTEPEEGEDVIKEFLKDSEDFYIIDTTLLFLREFMKNGFFRTFTHKNDMDGFFGVRLCRRV
jgi:16S rRNA (cytosine967-C5)-methyltransferase